MPYTRGMAASSRTQAGRDQAKEVNEPRKGSVPGRQLGAGGDVRDPACGYWSERCECRAVSAGRLLLMLLSSRPSRAWCSAAGIAAPSHEKFACEHRSSSRRSCWLGAGDSLLASLGALCKHVLGKLAELCRRPSSSPGDGILLPLSFLQICSILCSSGLGASAAPSLLSPSSASAWASCASPCGTHRQYLIPCKAGCYKVSLSKRRRRKKKKKKAEQI